jgi:hypothetical protein
VWALGGIDVLRLLARTTALIADVEAWLNFMGAQQITGPPPGLSIRWLEVAQVVDHVQGRFTVGPVEE